MTGAATTRIGLGQRAALAGTVPHELRRVFTQAVVTGLVGFVVLGLLTAVAPDLLGQDLGVASRAAAGLVAFSVFAASMAGQAMLGVIPEETALSAGCVGLIAGMGLLVLSLGLSSLALLVLSGVIAGLGQGLSFSVGLTALGARSAAVQHAQVASSFFVVAYIAISLPVIGQDVVAQPISLRVAGFAFVGLVAALSAAAQSLLIRAHRHRAGSLAGHVTVLTLDQGEPL